MKCEVEQIDPKQEEHVGAECSGSCIWTNIGMWI